MMSVPRTVLFVCTHNSGRSQMAEAFLNHRTPGRFRAFSAGTQPTSLSPVVVEVMAEEGIDISGQRAKDVREFMGWEFDYVITLCDQAQKACPFFSGGTVRLHQGFDDPSQCQGQREEVLACVRRIRGAIQAWLAHEFSRE
jgi:arsenate reductase